MDVRNKGTQVIEFRVDKFDGKSLEPDAEASKVHTIAPGQIVRNAPAAIVGSGEKGKPGYVAPHPGYKAALACGQLEEVA